MEYLVGLNWLAVLVAVFVTFMLGWAWHSDALFGKQWRAMTGMTGDEGGSMAMVWGVLNTLLCVVALGVLLQMAGADQMHEAVAIAVVAWAGVSLYDALGGVIWEKQPMARIYVNAGHALMVMLVSAAILTYMG